MTTLFLDDDSDRRERLVLRGWTQAGRNAQGTPLWRQPDGLAAIEEPAAFRWLARTEEEEEAARE